MSVRGHVALPGKENSPEAMNSFCALVPRKGSTAIFYYVVDLDVNDVKYRMKKKKGCGSRRQTLSNPSHRTRPSRRVGGGCSSIKRHPSIAFVDTAQSLAQFKKCRNFRDLPERECDGPEVKVSYNNIPLSVLRDLAHESEV